VTLSSEELLAGGALTYPCEVPAATLRPGEGGRGASPGRVVLRPLTVADLQRITRAARDSDSLASVLTVQRALVEPAMAVAEVASLHAGLVQFLLDKALEISGITADAGQLEESAEAPLARAAFVLAQEFGWTPEEIGDLTLGQVLLHLEMLRERAAG
jgi:hypothetical protein